MTTTEPSLSERLETCALAAHPEWTAPKLLREAAAELLRLQADNARLREALAESHKMAVKERARARWEHDSNGWNSADAIVECIERQCEAIADALSPPPAPETKAKLAEIEDKSP